MPNPLTIQALVEFLLGQPWAKRPDKKFLAWAPDSFAVAAKLLYDTGAYRNLLTGWPPKSEDMKQLSYQDWIESIGWNEWRIKREWKALPEQVLKWWRVIWEHRDRTLDEVSMLPAVWEKLTLLCAAADQASEGLLLPRSRDHESLPPRPLDEELFTRMIRYLNPGKDSSGPHARFSLCKTIAPDRVAVLPKMTTPQTGMNLRSLTHNLALVNEREVHTVWQQACRYTPDRLHFSINLLVLPWPKRIRPSQFVPANRQDVSTHAGNMPRESHDYFTFVPDPIYGELDNIARICVNAKAEFGQIDGVVLPEMALDEASYELLRQKLLEYDVGFLISGVYQKQSGKPSVNDVRMAFALDDQSIPSGDLILSQSKHHRWLIDSNQIRQYGLGASLGGGHAWWEFIELPQRKVNFVALSGHLVLAPLICEDLARADPVGNVIRAVGPNLVIALLQDGPQLAKRWSARYCTVLADDPGCSVLCVTSLGMVDLCRPNGCPPSRVVAIWKDADGATQEIELPQSADALMLSLSTRRVTQWSADGRSCNNQTGRVVLTNCYPISAK